MPKLVVLSPGLTGRSHDLKVDKTTIGRVEDNTIQLAEASVSSHHCEIVLQGSDFLVKDLGSTNGTFINGDKISESVLKPGQTLRLGQVEIRLETEGMPAPATATGTASVTPAKKPLDQTAVMRGVSLGELEQGPRTTGFDTTSKVFSKKSNQTNKWFLIGGIAAIVLIGLIILVAFLQLSRR